MRGDTVDLSYYHRSVLSFYDIMFAAAASFVSDAAAIFRLIKKRGDRRWSSQFIRRPSGPLFNPVLKIIPLSVCD